MVENHASKISTVMAEEVCRYDRHKILALFPNRAPRIVSASTHNASRAPLILLAAMHTPVPVQQKRMPSSALPMVMSRAMLMATSGHEALSLPTGP